MFESNYTWSKAMDTQTVSDWIGGDMGLVQNTYNPKANYGLANLDMPNVFNFQGVYQLPVGRGRQFFNQGGILNGVIGGWEVSGILWLHSGSPFTPAMSTVLDGSLGNAEYPNRSASGKVSNPSISEWFDPTAFATPAAYTFGNSGRDILLGPGYKDVDLSLSKSFPISQLHEGAQFAIRADAVDLFNHPNFGLPDSAIGTLGAGVISSSSTSRTLQLGIHFTF
jgi:hypothetical protein